MKCALFWSRSRPSLGHNCSEFFSIYAYPARYQRLLECRRDVATADDLRPAIKAMSEAAFPERFGIEEARRKALTVVRCVSRLGRAAARAHRWRTDEPEATLPERTHRGVPAPNQRFAGPALPT